LSSVSFIFFAPGLPFIRLPLEEPLLLDETRLLEPLLLDDTGRRVPPAGGRYRWGALRKVQDATRVHWVHTGQEHSEHVWHRQCALDSQSILRNNK
jgi:hypothetical protein